MTTEFSADVKRSAGILCALASSSVVQLELSPPAEDQNKITRRRFCLRHFLLDLTCSCCFPHFDPVMFLPDPL